MNGTKLAWPGNKAPLFRGNDENQQKLHNLVEELRGKYTTKYFRPGENRLRITDMLAERRRNIKIDMYIGNTTQHWKIGYKLC